MEIIEKLTLNSRKVLINFSPALDLCNLARGRLDAVIDKGTTPEDHAAGGIIVLEAGGKINSFGHHDWDLNKTGIIASNHALHESISKLLVN